MKQMVLVACIRDPLTGEIALVSCAREMAQDRTPSINGDR